MAERVETKRPKKAKRKHHSNDINENLIAIKKPRNEEKLHMKWDEEADNELIRLIEESIHNRSRNRPKLIFSRHVDWKGIAERLKSDKWYDLDSASLRARWDELSKQVRKVRTVPEMIDDVKKAVKFHIDRVPKMPLGSYQLFCMSKRPRIKEKYPDMSFSELSKRMGKKWRELPPEKRQKYERRAKEKKDMYQERMKEWRLENPGGFEELNGEVNMKLPEKLQDVSPFDVFCNKKSASIREKHTGIDEEVLLSKLKKRWNKMKEHKKEKYNIEAENLNAEQRKKSKQQKSNVKKKTDKKQKPLSSYGLFLKEKRKELLAYNEKLGFGEISKMCAKYWKELDPKERLEFEEKAKVLNAARPEMVTVKVPSKKPLNAYKIYFKEKRLQLLEENPDLEFGEIASLCAAAWKNLTKDEISPYKEKENQMKKEYEEVIRKMKENQTREE